MFAFTEEERIGLRHMHSLSQDEQGREVLIGLSWNDTAYLMEHRRNFAKSIRQRDPDRKSKALVLGNNHELARLRRIGELTKDDTP
jgi:hypothetical protein